MSRGNDLPSMSELQQADYGENRDYEVGSPHLRHDFRRNRIENDLSALVRDQIELRGQCRVLEIGGGHGTFTACLVAAGASVIVTEMSAPSADTLRRRFEHSQQVRVVYDPGGDATELARQGCDLVVIVSVLHHIPDYIEAAAGLVDHVSTGGAFYSVQDPMWYPDRSRVSLMLDRGAYFLWRLSQGQIRRGLATRWRRARGIYDPSSPSDMVEYHVVRQGVNQGALAELLRQRFRDVDVHLYWSTQASVLQRVGDRLGLLSTFGVAATGRIESKR